MNSVDENPTIPAQISIPEKVGLYTFVKSNIQVNEVFEWILILDSHHSCPVFNSSESNSVYNLLDFMAQIYEVLLSRFYYRILIIPE